MYLKYMYFSIIFIVLVYDLFDNPSYMYIEYFLCFI